MPVVITELSVGLGIVYWKFDRIDYSMIELKNAHRAARNCNYEHTKNSYNVGKYATGRRQSLCICCNRNNVFIFIYSAALLDVRDKLIHQVKNKARKCICSLHYRFVRQKPIGIMLKVCIKWAKTNSLV